MFLQINILHLTFLPPCDFPHVLNTHCQTELKGFSTCKCVCLGALVCLYANSNVWTMDKILFFVLVLVLIENVQQQKKKLYYRRFKIGQGKYEVFKITHTHSCTFTYSKCNQMKRPMIITHTAAVGCCPSTVWKTKNWPKQI